jgi:predicted  nucleic acid-binding Zn-ribbon protein
MSQTETQDILSETGLKDDGRGTMDEGRETNESLKFVPVAESIRYRKRAQLAEKKLESLAEELSQTKTESAKMSEQLKSVQTEQKIMRKLTAAGAVDLEAAVLIAKARIEDEPEAGLDGVIEQLRKEKQYLFAGGAVTAKKTAGVKERVANSQTVLDTAAKRAATTGNRIDLQKYLRLRRNFL